MCDTVRYDSLDQSPSIMQNRDISVAWTSFLMKACGMWLAADETEKRNRKMAFMVAGQMFFFALCLGVRDLYFRRDNFDESIYVACNLSYVVIVVFKIVVVNTHKEKVHNIIRLTQKAFWDVDYKGKDKSIFEDCKKLCTFLVVSLNMSINGTCIGYAVTPLIVNIGKNKSERVLPFNTWIDLPIITMSPYYETISAMQMISVYYVGMCYTCFDCILCILSLHAAAQFRILRYAFMDLASGISTDVELPESWKHVNEINMKLKHYIRRHQMLIAYCVELENAFTLVVGGQVVYLALELCLLGYQLVLMDTPASRDITLILNTFAALCQLFMITYSCDCLIRHSIGVSDAVYSSGWPQLPMNDVGRDIRRSTVLIILRASKPCFLTASGFFPVSLETFTKVLSTAMSYFTLLRESTEENA